MFQNPNQKARAIAAAKKRERDRNRKSIHIKRIHAELELFDPAGTLEGKTTVRLILNDLTKGGVGVFSPDKVVPGQKVTLSIHEPLQIKVQGRIIWCQLHVASTHVLSEQNYQFRLGIEFQTSTDEERQAISAFYDEVTKIHLYSKTAV